MKLLGCKYLRHKFYRHYKRYNEIFQESIEKYISTGKLILDAGCGIEARYVKKYHPQIVGIDLEVSSVNNDFKIVKGNLEYLPFRSECLDLIISKSVFEHLENPLKVLKEFHRILKKDAYGIVLTPAKYDYVSIINILLPEKVRLKIHRSIVLTRYNTFKAYYRVNSPYSIRKLFRQANLEIIQVNFFTQDPHYLKFSSLLFLIGILYERIVKRLSFLASMRNWCIIVFKK